MTFALLTLYICILINVAFALLTLYICILITDLYVHYLGAEYTLIMNVSYKLFT